MLVAIVCRLHHIAAKTAMTRRVRSCLMLLLGWQLHAVCKPSLTAFAGGSALSSNQRLEGLTVQRVRERCHAAPRARQRQTRKQADGFTPAKVITSRVKNVATASEVLVLMQLEHDNPNMDLIAISAAWSSFAQRKRSITAEVTASSSFSMLVQLSRSLLKKPAGLARSVANILWATARIQGHRSSQLATLWTSLASAVKTTAKDMNEQELANVIWGVAKLTTTNPDCEELLSVLPALARRVPAVISGMTSQAVANVMWATGQLSIESGHAAMSRGLREKLSFVVSRAMVLLPSATPQELANSCWGLALSEHHNQAFLQAAAEKVANEAAQWKAELVELNLPPVLLAFARLKARGYDAMLVAAADQLSPMLARVNDWGLCATVWSYRQLHTQDEFLALRQKLKAEVARRHFSEQDVERSRLGPEAWWMHAAQPKTL